MARVPTTFYSTASGPTVKTEVVSAVAATTRIIRKATFTNNTGGTLLVDLYIDPTGSQEVQLADQHTIIDQETWSCPDIEGHILSPSGTIDITISGAGMDIVISGVNVT